MPLIFNALAIAGVLAVGGLHMLAVAYSWYWLYPHVDIPLHFLGGLTMGLWAAAVSWRLGLGTRRAAALFAAVALVGGLGWEVFEFILGLVPYKEGFWSDTLLDLGADAVGAVAVFGAYALCKRA